MVDGVLQHRNNFFFFFDIRRQPAVGAFEGDEHVVTDGGVAWKSR